MELITVFSGNSVLRLTRPATDGTVKSQTGPGGVTYWAITTVRSNRDYWHTVETSSRDRAWWTKNAHSRALGTPAPSTVVVPSTPTSVEQIREALRYGEFRVAGFR